MKKPSLPADIDSQANPAAVQADYRTARNGLPEKSGAISNNSVPLGTPHFGLIELHKLLQRVIDLLPVAITVQDQSGRFIFANTLAANNMATPLDDLVGATPSDFLPHRDALDRREWEKRIIEEKQSITFESSIAVSDRVAKQNWLTTYETVDVGGEPFLISHSVDITVQRQREHELMVRAEVDELTGLPRTSTIQNTIDTIIRNDPGDNRFALAFVDLDNFKNINDYYGHAAGDAILVNIAKRVTAHLRPGDMFARLSGDEFLLLLNPCESQEQAEARIDELSRDLRQPYQIGAYEIFGSCSIGVSQYPEHGRCFEDLCRNADSAMYRAKRLEKGSIVHFDDSISEEVNARAKAEQRLRFAIRDEKFCCAFQPKVEISSRKVVGFEALVRWRDDDGEIYPPGQFIGLATELGLINPITSFVLANAIKSMDYLDATFGPDTTISINVAPKQANDKNFMTSLIKTLKNSNRADRLIIELTEDAFIPDGVFQTDVLPCLRSLGVRISIDDFGTGYSSLGVLTDIVADELKIDRSFISHIHERPRSQSVLKAIESLGLALGMTLVAEGVETHEELLYLQAASSIRCVQGFYFARPFYLDSAPELCAVADRINGPARVITERQPFAPPRADRIVRPAN